MAAERAGVPAVVNTCEGFVSQAHATAELGGQPWLPVVNYPGHIDLYPLEERNNVISEVIAPESEEALTTPIAGLGARVETPETEIAFTGTFEEVLTHYRENMWSDGLPIIPPTKEKVEEFLKYTDYPADAILGRPMPPAYREATPWWVAVNGVMAGCRPQYMPVLIAMTKAWSEPDFEGQNSSSTPGWSPVTIISGPIKKQLGLNVKHNYGTPGYVSNSSMGRFWAMFKRNLMEIRIEVPTDMGTHGFNWFNLSGENEDLCQEYGWKTLAEEQGFGAMDNVVTTMSCHTQTQAPALVGDTGDDLMYRIAGAICEAQGAGWRLFSGWYMFVITALVGQVLARDGWDKDSMQEYLYDNARLTARYLETRYEDSGEVGSPGLGYYCEQVRQGTSWARPEYCESEDPDRLIPMFRDRSKIRFILGGDEARNRISCWQNNGGQGALTSMKIELPKDWDALYDASQLKKDLDDLPAGREKYL